MSEPAYVLAARMLNAIGWDGSNFRLRDPIASVIAPELARREKQRQPEYRPWASLAEMVEDGACDWWFILSDEIGWGRVWKISSMSHTLVTLCDAESIDDIELDLLFGTMKCSPSPLGPWQPCGRKL